MATTDTTEQGLEKRIVDILTGVALTEELPSDSTKPVPGQLLTWIQGSPADYDRANCVDLIQLSEFLGATQPETAVALSLGSDNPTRRKFLNRVRTEIRKRGTIDVLRKGINDYPHHVDLFYATPTPGNTTAAERHAQNRFSVTRQLRYSNDEKQRALDLALFINGLPIATFELKNNLTGQTVTDAINQYRLTRNHREELFRAGRCAAHFAVDEQEVQFCTRLNGKASIFLPFNKGRDDAGAGNPVNPNGLRTDYLWQEILTPESLTDIIENYAQKVGNAQIWPRYHQLDVVRSLLANATTHGPGRRYLVQHSAGSGKSNSIAWLSRQLIEVTKDGKPAFDSIIIVTDRVVLDDQIHEIIKQFTQVANTVARAETSAELRQYINEGKKIITTTIQKFPIIYSTMGTEHGGRNFAIIIDEAHSSQGGRTAAAMSASLSTTTQANHDDDYDTFEDQINRIIESHQLLANASYFAFTATPKNKTLELFGEPFQQEDGTTKRLPFHTYSMKQAIQEGFILDVLGNHTTVDTYFSIVKAIDDDPEFDSTRAQRKLRKFVEGNPEAIQTKAEIMVDHFHESVYLPKKIQGNARAMVVTDGVDRAIEYYTSISAYITERGHPYRAIIAFSGERDYGGDQVSESKLNQFPSNQIPDQIQKDPYRILICADKFQTGYDEPLLHTMYVDKTLAGIKAVQTLSRLNRARPNKSETFVLDFMNKSDTIREAFSDYYRTTILADETDPNKLHDLKATLDQHQIYSPDQVDQFVKRYLDGEDRDTLDPTLDVCVEMYMNLSEDSQVEFKGTAKAFNRLYAFLSQVLPYGNPEWEKLSIFLHFLIPRLPAPEEDDLSRGILEAVDMDTYRAERNAAQAIALEDDDAEIDPVLAGGGGHLHEPELEPLSQIVATFNQLWGSYVSHPDQMRRAIESVPEQVANEPAYKNAILNSDAQNTRTELDSTLGKIITMMAQTNTELYKLFTENPEFKTWLTNETFNSTYNSGKP